MDIKNNKGYVGVDISVAVIILLILVPTIMGIVFVINRSKNMADIKSVALNIATNAIETAKGINVSNLTAEGIVNSLSTNIYSGKTQDTTLDEDEDFTAEEKNDENITVEKIAVITDKASYKLKIKVTDYKKQNQDATSGIVRTVNATVIYKAGNKKESLDISTVLK